MGKRIAVFFVVLTAVLIVAGAFLPEIAAAVMDASIHDKTGTAPMQPLELEVREDAPTNEEREYADLTAKLILASRMYTIPIRDNGTSMSEGDVFAAAEKAMTDYIDAGIFEWFDVTYSSADPMLGLDAENPENYMTFWTVYFANESDPYQTLLLHIDDETGRVLYIKYEKYGSFSMEGVWERNRKLLESVTSVFFRQAGLSEAKDYADSTGIGLEILEHDGGVTCMRYSFGDVLYGELNIEFYATGTGEFETYFPAAE